MFDLILAKFGEPDIRVTVVFSMRVSFGKTLLAISRNGGTAVPGMAPVGIAMLSNDCSIIALSSTLFADTTTR
jgi:hypothetical protein